MKWPDYLYSLARTDLSRWSGSFFGMASQVYVWRLIRLTLQNKFFLPNLFLSCFLARLLAYPGYNPGFVSLQWGCYVVIFTIHLFLLEKWERRRGNQLWCRGGPTIVFAIFVSCFLACAYSLATITESLHWWAILAIHFLSRIFFHSHGIFFFLSIGLFPSIFIQNFFSLTQDKFSFSPLGYFSHPFLSRNFFHSHGIFFSFSPLGYFHPFSSGIFFALTWTIFLSLHWAILAIHFCREIFFIHTDNFSFSAALRAILAIHFCPEGFFIHTDSFSFSPLGYF